MRHALAAILAIAPLCASAADAPALCFANHQLIERSLKVIASDITGVTSDDLDARVHRLGPPSIAKPARVASAWGQIHAALAHMQQLNCEPYPLPIDPSEYFSAVFNCNAQKGPDTGGHCNQANWKRSEWRGHR